MGGRRTNTDGTGHIAAQKGDIFGRGRVLWVMGKDEHRSLPSTPVGPAPGCRGLVSAVTAAEDRTGRGHVLIEQARSEGEVGHPVHIAAGSGHDPSMDVVKCHRTSPDAVWRRGIT